jgi:cytidylate kinase
VVPVITIDGPVASGKGTVASQLAKVLGWHYLDSGALYRLSALASLNAGLSIDDSSLSERALAIVAAQMNIAFRDGTIYLEGLDVTDAVRAEAVGEVASRIATLPAVRAALLEVQRGFRQAPGLVADGRDMGTVVFPDAQLKVFLTASAHSRALRRTKQLIEKGFSANFDSLFAELLRRDERDMHRAIAPLTPAQGAFLLDSTELSIEQTVQAMLEAYEKR